MSGFDEDWDLFDNGPKLQPGVRQDLLKRQLDDVVEKSSNELKKLIVDRYSGVSLSDPETWGHIISQGVRIFMTNWQNSLHDLTLNGLIGIILDNKNLSPGELLAFIRALPISILDRGVSTVNPPNGIAALLALEINRRSGGPEYTIHKDPNQRLYAKVKQPDDEYLILRLEDVFPTPNAPEVPTE